MKYSKTKANMHIKGYWNKNSSTKTKRMSSSYLPLPGTVVCGNVMHISVIKEIKKLIKSLIFLKIMARGKVGKI